MVKIHIYIGIYIYMYVYFHMHMSACMWVYACVFMGLVGHLSNTLSCYIASDIASGYRCRRAISFL